MSKNRADIAADLIRDAILEGRLKPGQRLMAAELANKLGISRTPIREALLILQTGGLVSWSANKGARVRTYDEEDIDDLYQLRAALEGHIARLAAVRATEADVFRCEQSCDRLKKIDDTARTADLIKENNFFHDELLRIAGTRRLKAAMRLAELPYIYRSFYWRSSLKKRASEFYHVEITKCLKVHDAERAESLMKEHVLDTRDFLVKELTHPSKPDESDS